MEKISIKFNGNGGVRIDQSISLKEKAAKYNEASHILPADFSLRNDYQTLAKLYDKANQTDNAIYAHEFEKLKAHLVAHCDDDVEVYVDGVLEGIK